MSIQAGYIDDDGHPRISLRVEGTISSATADIEALIDTGFAGFLALPIGQALPLGLALVGTGNYGLADGSKVTNFLALGKITIGPSISRHPETMPVDPDTLEDETVEGLIVLCGDEALVGMEFIRAMNKMLIIGGNTVMLADADPKQGQ